ncbi:MAG: phenylalanine--tRNA ligase subunit alpha [bacterium]
MKENKTIHPLTDIIYRMATIFNELGFSFVDGPELETEHYNFDTLNVPKDHPARDMQDTFWTKPWNTDGLNYLMRTQTSAVQVRYMEKNQPPFRVFSIGKVYRQEASDATHDMQFNQMEGLYIAKKVSMADLKATVNQIFDKFFERDINVRFRPSFFPFVEPGAEVDVTCFKCGGQSSEGCNICKGTGWIEVGGAGMVHPNVLKSAGIDSNEWQGFAFGFGVERFIMTKYGVDDIRLISNGDLRVINQFEIKTISD